MNILFAIKSMEAQGGGAERVLAEIASGLAESGHRVSLLSFDRPGYRSFYPLHPAIERIAVNIGDPKRSARFYETGRRVLAMREQVVDMRPDIVVGFMHSMFIPMGLALAGTGIALIASEHIVPGHYSSRPFQALLLRLAPYLTRLITVVSQQTLEAYPADLRAHMMVVPNPVGMRVSRRADVIGAMAGRKKLLVVGRLDAQKDHATLIDAYARIADAVPDWDLRIVGDGALRRDIEAKVAGYGLERRVEMPGVIKDIAKEYASAQLFVMPSSYESFGLATAEALCHGLPAIGFADCPGTNELIRSGHNGVLVAPGDDRAGALAAALARLMNDPEARLRYAFAGGGAAGPTLVSLLATWEEILLAAGYKRSDTGQLKHDPQRRRVFPVPSQSP